MQKLLSIFAIGIVTLGFAFTASARTWSFTSTTGIKLGFGPVIIITGVGVATINGTGGGSHLTTLRLAAVDPKDTPPVPVTDPETTGTIASNILDLGSGSGGTFAPISGAAMSAPLTQNILALGGVSRICIVFSGCANSIPLVLDFNGVGGIVTTGFPGPIRLSLFNAPWQLKTATRIQSTANGATITRMFHGFVHGPASHTSSTAFPSGVIKLITPIQVITQGIAGNMTKTSLFTSITLRFIPEPGLVFLLGSGVIGLALLGRSRIRKE